MDTKEEEINKYMLENMSETMYHGCSGFPYDSKEDFKQKIEIFQKIDDYIKFEQIHGKHKNKLGQEVPFRSKGRPNLDAAFHGIYFTPNFRSAESIAMKKRKSGGQIVVVKVDKVKLSRFNGISLCFPNLDWGRFIIENRKEDTTENKYDYSYSLIADGHMADLTPIIQTIDKNYISDVFQELINKDLRKLFQNRDLTWDYDGFMKSPLITEGLLFQLCLSNKQCLNCIEVVDIITLERSA